MLILHAFTVLFLMRHVLGQEGVGITGGDLLSSYTCPIDCKLPECNCASTKTPGGFDAQNIPQFMSLTFDDSVNSVIFPIIENITMQGINPNGCPISSTFFVSTLWTDYRLIQRLFNLGHEIAVHTMNHVGSPSSEEISGALKALSAFAGIPKNSIRGFRVPFLQYSINTYQELYKLNYLYDSSMSVNYVNSPVWPYTLDHGFATNCNTGPCPIDSSFPAMWTVPMYTIVNADGSLNAAMDPNSSFKSSKKSDSPVQNDLLEILKINFMNRYNSTRVPMGLYLHAASSVNQEERTQAYVDFIKWTLQFKDVYWIDNQKLISWIKNPTNIVDSLTNPALNCVMPPTSPSNIEICDGIDNNGDGQIDEGLISNCYYPSVQLGFSSCFGCPPAYPNVSNPVPVSASNSPNFIPDSGCPNNQSWNSKDGKCINLIRLEKGPIQSYNSLPNSEKKGRKNKTSKSISFPISTVLLFITTIFVLFM